MNSRKQSLMRKNLPLLVLRCAAGIVFAVSNIALGQLSRRFYDEVILSGSQGSLWSLGLLYLLALAAFLVFYAAQEILSVHIEERSAAILREKVYSGYLRKPLRETVGIRSGELVTNITSDVDQLRPTGGTLIVNCLCSLFLLTALLWWMFSTSSMLAWFLLPAPLLFCIAMIFFSTKMFMIAEKYQNCLAESNHLIAGIVRASDTIRLFFLKAAARQRCLKTLAELAEKAVRKDVANAKMQSVWNLIMTPYQALFYLWAGLAYLNHGQPSLGTIIAFSNFVSFLIYPMMSLLGGLSGLGQIQAGRKRLSSLLDKSETAESRMPQQPARGDIRIRNVCFSYDQEKEALQDVSCTIPGGKTTVLWGAPGSGKTTLAKLILGLYKPDSGSIAWQSGDREYDAGECGKRIGFLEQHPFLFAGSIRDNLLLGMKDTPPEKMKLAAQHAWIEEKILSMPDRYNTVLDEKIQLSGGEKQRLALARCFVRHSDVLLLAEPSYALNADLAKDLLSGLKENYPDMTMVIISHDPAVLDYADKVIRLSEGHVVSEKTA